VAVKIRPMPKFEPRIVVIGGGTGSFALLKELKNYTSSLTALVNMADDGGSTGVLRDELGVLPPGDIRQCLVALSEAPEELRELFNFRFPRGTFKGHSFGNIFLSAVEKMVDNFEDAVRLASEVLRIKGQVLPITLDNCRLVLRHGDQEVIGQYNIVNTKLPTKARPQIYFEKLANITPKAALAIKTSDLIVIAPGNLYASLAPSLLVEGVAATLRQSKATKVFVCNLVNKPNHTVGFKVGDYAKEIERFISKGTLDYVLYNTDLPSKELLDKYALDQEFPVGIDSKETKAASYKMIGGNFLSHSHETRNENDSFIKRSLIRHDGQAVAKALLELI